MCALPVAYKPAELDEFTHTAQFLKLACALLPAWKACDAAGSNAIAQAPQSGAVGDRVRLEVPVAPLSLRVAVTVTVVLAVMDAGAL